MTHSGVHQNNSEALRTFLNNIDFPAKTGSIIYGHSESFRALSAPHLRPDVGGPGAVAPPPRIMVGSLLPLSPLNGPDKDNSWYDTQGNIFSPMIMDYPLDLFC